MLPPWLLMMTSLRIPARATLSPISMNARSAVSGESVSVPRNARCSSEAPTACTGRNTAGESSGSSARTRAEIRFRDVGIDADRQMRPVLLDRRDRQHGDARAARILRVVSESQSVTQLSVVMPA